MMRRHCEVTRRAMSRAQPVLDLSRGTFTRSSEASALQSASTMSWFGVDVLRRQSAPGSSGWLLEGARTNLVYQSESTSTTPWVLAHLADPTANYGVAPDGTQDADRYVIDGVYGSYQTMGASTQARVLTVWAKANGVAQVGKSIRIMQGIEANNPATHRSCRIQDALPAAWARFTGPTRTPTGAAGNSDLALIHMAGYPDATDLVLPACDLLIWGWMLEAGTWATSYTRTTTAPAVRSADVLTFAALGTVARSKPWSTIVSTEWSLADRSSCPIVCGESGNELLSWNGTNFVVYAGGVEKVVSNAITASSNQPLRVAVNPSAGMIGVWGATAGDGVVTGTSWTWADEAYRIGGTHGGNDEWFGTIQNFMPI